MPPSVADGSEADTEAVERVNWNMQRDRKLLLYIAKIFLNRDMKIDNKVAAVKLSCSERAVEERLKKIKKMAMIETDPDTPFEMLPYGDRPFGQTNRYTTHDTPLKAIRKKTATPASRKGKEKATVEGGDETIEESEYADATDSAMDTNDSGANTPRKRKYRGEDGPTIGELMAKAGEPALN